MNSLASIHCHGFHKSVSVVYNFTFNGISYAGTTQGTYSSSLASGNGIVMGTTPDSSYNVYAFGNDSTAGTYVINYTCNTSANVYLLAVGGGGQGGGDQGGGGGAGGLISTDWNN